MDESISREPSRTLQFSNSTVTIKDQLKDYKFRNSTLSSMNLYDFILNTYESDSLAESTGVQDGTTSKQRGRPRNDRHPYLAEANKGNICRIVKYPGHETVPRINGSWFPRNDKVNEQSLQNAVMLALFVPWRSISDLKAEHETFEDKYHALLNTLDRKRRAFIENAQYYHECLDGVKEEERNSRLREDGTQNQRQDLQFIRAFHDPEDQPVSEITEEDVELARMLRSKPNERLYAEAAIDSAIQFGIFSENTASISSEPIASTASDHEQETIASWEKQLREYNRTQPRIVVGEEEATVPYSNASALPATEMADDSSIQNPHSTSTVVDHDTPSNVSTRPKYHMLNRDQKRAHDIIEERLLQHLAGKLDCITPKSLFQLMIFLLKFNDI